MSQPIGATAETCIVGMSWVATLRQRSGKGCGYSISLGAPSGAFLHRPSAPHATRPRRPRRHSARSSSAIEQASRRAVEGALGACAAQCGYGIKLAFRKRRLAFRLREAETRLRPVGTTLQANRGGLPGAQTLGVPWWLLGNGPGAWHGVCAGMVCRVCVGGGVGLVAPEPHSRWATPQPLGHSTNFSSSQEPDAPH